MELRYQTGFGNQFCTEALNDTLPKGQNSPQCPPKGLYAEQLSGTAFTAPRAHNLRSWLYRIRPSVIHGDFTPLPHPTWQTAPISSAHVTPNQLRWSPAAYPDQATDFIQSLCSYASCGDAHAHNGAGALVYAATQSMAVHNQFFYNSDGELLILPQEGALHIKTELGALQVEPGMCAVIARGIKFQVNLVDDKARGYVCENYGQPFQLPDLGPIGANGLANARDFQVPVADYVDQKGHFTLLTKYQGRFFSAELDHHPCDVVAWHGNYVPYRYDCRLFNTINTVSYDHPDPSIFTVLTSQSGLPGVANVDFVIFPPRWMVAEHSFRPPYFHRNVMSEFMGLIYGEYDAKETGFVPGGASLHNCMAAHGPDSDILEKARKAKLKPQYTGNTLAFMLETRFAWRTSAHAMQLPMRQTNYRDCWQNIPAHFNKFKDTH